jgi:hypothetical protein
VGALGADRAGEAGAHPGQVVSAIIPTRRIGGRVVVVLTSCAGGGRRGYGRGGRGSPPCRRRMSALSTQSAITSERVSEQLRWAVALFGVGIPVDPRHRGTPDTARLPHAVRPVRWRGWTPPNALTQHHHDDEEKVTDEAGNEAGNQAGKHPGRRGSFPLPPQPSFPHLTSNDDRGGSTIAVLEHELKPPEPGVGPHPADSLPASQDRAGSRQTQAPQPAR